VTTPLRLLAVANWSFARIRSTWAEERIAALRRAGVEVDVIDVDCASSRLGFARLWAKVLRATRQRRYDAIMPFYGSLTALLCAWTPGVPLVAAFAGSDINGQGVERRPDLGVLMSQLATLWAREVVVPVPSMAARFWHPRWRQRAHVIPASVDTARFTPMPRDEARRQLGVALEPRLVAFVATDPDARVKRRDLAEATMVALPEEERAVLQVLARVPFERMPLWYAACDALLVTSDAEGGPVAVKEALACGLPVVSVDCGDVAEVVAGLDHCAIAERDPAALAAALVSILTRGARCAGGPARIAERYGLDAMARRYRDVIARAASRSPAGEVHE
jgi:glycosyltransferase involved in cell wall biosynthesis